MDAILIAIIIILCQYPLAILTLIALFRSSETKNAMIVWNVFIIGVPFIGALIYWIYFLIKGRKKSKKTVSVSDNAQSEE